MLDRALVPTDRVIGTSADDANATVNFNLLQLGEFFSQTGLAQSFVGFTFQVGDPNDTYPPRNIQSGGMYFNATTPQDVTRVIISRRTYTSTQDVAGANTDPLVEALRGDVIVISSSDSVADRAYAFYDVSDTAPTMVMRNDVHVGWEIELVVQRHSSMAEPQTTGSLPSRFASLSPLGVASNIVLDIVSTGRNTANTATEVTFSDGTTITIPDGAQGQAGMDGDRGRSVYAWSRTEDLGRGLFNARATHPDLVAGDLLVATNTTTSFVGTVWEVTTPAPQTIVTVRGNIRGPQGDAGMAGAAATITVGTTTTGAPGSMASVTNSGTTSAAVFNFTVPQGPQGTPGERGQAGPTATVTKPSDMDSPINNVNTFQFEGDGVNIEMGSSGVARIIISGGGGGTPVETPPDGSITGFNRTRFNQDTDDFFLRSTFTVPSGGTLTSFEFQQAGTLVAGSRSTTATSPYQFEVTGSMGSQEDYTAVLNYTDTEGDALSLTSVPFGETIVLPADPTLTITPTFASFSQTPTFSNRVIAIERGDTGTVSYAVATTDGQWTPTAVATTIAQTTVAASATPADVSSSRTYNTNGRNNPELTRTASETISFTRTRSLRYGFTTDTAFDATELATLSNFIDTNTNGRRIDLGTINPNGASFSIAVPDSNRVYIIYDATQPALRRIFDPDSNTNNIGGYTATTVDGYRVYISNTTFAATTFDFELFT